MQIIVIIFIIIYVLVVSTSIFKLIDIIDLYKDIKSAHYRDVSIYSVLIVGFLIISPLVFYYSFYYYFEQKRLFKQIIIKNQFALHECTYKNNRYFETEVEESLQIGLKFLWFKDANYSRILYPIFIKTDLGDRIIITEDNNNNPKLIINGK